MNISIKFKLLISAFLIVILVSSCVPSLHPIYTESTTEVDDRLLGTWSMESSSALVSVEYDIEITTEGNRTIRYSNTDTNSMSNEEMIRDAFQIDRNKIFPSSQSIWTFERAANISFEKKSSGSISAFVSMTLGAPSFVPEGFEITESEELSFYILTHKELEDGDTTVSYLLVHMTEIGGEMYLDFVPFPKGDKRRQGAFAANYISGHTFAKVGFENGKLSIRMFDGEFIKNLVKSRKMRLRHERLGIDGDIVLTASTRELRAFIDKYGNNTEMFDEAQVFAQL